jgi:hypothetical protein
MPGASMEMEPVSAQTVTHDGGAGEEPPPLKPLTNRKDPPEMRNDETFFAFPS